MREGGEGKLDFVETIEGIDCFIFVDFLRLTTFLNDHSSLLLSNRDVTTPPSRWKKLITRIGIFLSSWNIG